MKSTWWMLGLSVCVCLWAHGARAADCKQSSDCPKGYSCHEDSVAHRECVPSACSSNADCADFMICYELTIKECTQPIMTAAPECTEHKSKQCTPRYELPCTADVDCGDGFTCKASEQGMCSGSSESDASVCEHQTSELKYCYARPIGCEADMDCPVNFECVALKSAAVGCSGADAGACASDAKRCQPKYTNSDARVASKDGSVQGPSPAGASGAHSDPASDASCSVRAPGAGGSTGYALGLALLVLQLRRRRQR